MNEADFDGVAVTDAQLDALVDAADGGVSFDGLTVRREGDDDAGRYAFATPTADRSGLTAGELRTVAREHPTAVTNWYYWTQTVGDRRRGGTAYLRWLEGAEDRPVGARYEALAGGVSRAWGEVHVTASLAADGGRRYALRHVDDASADRADLVPLDGRADLRDLVTEDRWGRYRPLKTAPSLQTGWRVDDVDPDALLEAVDVIYPATVANWHREREGELDVTHWRECADRQTGIYDVVDELDRQAVEWVAQACCVDSQCLKRREWEYDDETPVGVDGGDGEFPCREPCSLVVAAARKWTQLEREQSRTYEFELTPSEKEQLETILDAVADGRVPDVREADVYDGANRYRARYLRAKRTDAEGNLSGTPTHPDDGDGTTDSGE
jgi:hypothetical protein